MLTSFKLCFFFKTVGKTIWKNKCIYFSPHFQCTNMAAKHLPHKIQQKYKITSVFSVQNIRKAYLWIIFIHNHRINQINFTLLPNSFNIKHRIYLDLSKLYHRVHDTSLSRPQSRNHHQGVRGNQCLSAT